jgi:hypothetical protein
MKIQEPTSPMEISYNIIQEIKLENNKPAKASPDDNSLVLLITEQELNLLLVKYISETQLQTRNWALNEKEEIR